MAQGMLAGSGIYTDVGTKYLADRMLAGSGSLMTMQRTQERSALSGSYTEANAATDVGAKYLADRRSLGVGTKYLADRMSLGDSSSDMMKPSTSRGTVSGDTASGGGGDTKDAADSAKAESMGITSASDVRGLSDAISFGGSKGLTTATGFGLSMANPSLGMAYGVATKGLGALASAMENPAKFGFSTVGSVIGTLSGLPLGGLIGGMLGDAAYGSYKEGLIGDAYDSRTSEGLRDQAENMGFSTSQTARGAEVDSTMGGYTSTSTGFGVGVNPAGYSLDPGLKSMSGVYGLASLGDISFGGSTSSSSGQQQGGTPSESAASEMGRASGDSGLGNAASGGGGGGSDSGGSSGNDGSGSGGATGGDKDGGRY